MTGEMVGNFLFLGMPETYRIEFEVGRSEDLSWVECDFFTGKIKDCSDEESREFFTKGEFFVLLDLLIEEGVFVISKPNCSELARYPAPILRTLLDGEIEYEKTNGEITDEH